MTLTRAGVFSDRHLDVQYQTVKVPSWFSPLRDVSADTPHAGRDVSHGGGYRPQHGVSHGGGYRSQLVADSVLQAVSSSMADVFVRREGYARKKEACAAGLALLD